MSKEEKDTSSLTGRNKELYRREQPTSSGIPDLVDPIRVKEPPPPEEPPGPSWKDRFWGWIDGFPVKRGLIGVIVLGVLIAAVLLWRGFFSFQNSNVSLIIEPTEAVAVGEEISWDVTIVNDNVSAIENVELTFHYPERSVNASTSEPMLRDSRQIERVGGRSEHVESFRSVFIAGGEKEVRAIVSFTQEDSSTTFEVTHAETVTPEDFPVVITTEGPDETLPGEEITVSFTLESEAELPLHNLRTRLVYPEGFVFSSADQTLEEANTIWRIGTLNPDEERTLQVTGTVSGEAEQGRIFRFFLEGRTGPTTWEEYHEDSFRTILATTPLSVSIEPSRKTVVPEDELSFTIRWRNDFDASLNNVKVEATLDGQMYDLSELNTDGAFNVRTRTITWSEAQISGLASLRSGQTGEARFSITLADEYRPFGVTNPRVRVRAVVSSPTKPAGLTTSGVRAIHETEVRVRGALDIAAEGFYNEPLAPFGNAGPYPPQVGEVSTFTLHWRLRAHANSFNDVVVTSTLPSWVEWADQTYINGPFGEISYNAPRREVQWRIAELKANQGLSSQVPEAVFQVRAIPAPHQEGSPMPLLEDTQVQGLDVFADTTVTTKADRIDSSLGGKGGRVQP